MLMQMRFGLMLSKSKRARVWQQVHPLRARLLAEIVRAEAFGIKDFILVNTNVISTLTHIID
jgi:hypothetical protein